MQPLTITGPIPFGYERPGSVAQAEMLDRCVAVVGEPGSGKSNVEHNFVAGLLRCPDCLVWPIDLSGAGIALPWLNPWLDGDMRSPVLDWVATDVGEALAMTETALQIIIGRRTAYRQFMARRNVDKLAVSHDLPAIYIVLDEGREAVGPQANQTLVSNLARITDMGRGMRVRLLMTGLRATADTIPSAMMTNIGIRVGMSVASEAEAHYLFGWKFKPNPRDTPYPGCGLWRDGLIGSVRPFRSYYVAEPRTLARIAQACEPWRPALDEPSLAGVSPELRAAYVSRWERVLPMLTGDGLTAPPSVPVSPASPGRPSPNVLDFDPVDRKIATARRVIAGSMPAAVVESRFAELAERFADERATGGEGWDSAPPAQQDWRERALGLLDAAGSTGMSGPKLLDQLAAEGLQVAKSTLYDWLTGNAVKAGYGAYLHPRHRSAQ